MDKETKLPGTEELEDVQVDGELTEEEMALFGRPDDEEEDQADQKDKTPAVVEGKEEEVPNTETEEEEVPEDADKEETSTEEPKDEVVDPKKDWTLEDYKNGYQNLEKLVGKQGQELGELRKTVTAVPKEQKEYSIEDIPNMEESVLNEFINKYETALADPALEFEDQDKFNAIKKEYALLAEERSIRKAMARIEHKSAQEKLSGIKSQIAKKYTLTEDELKVITEKATKLSDNGIPSENEFEAAVYAVNPKKFGDAKIQQVSNRVERAKTKETPRIPSGSDKVDAPKVTLKQYQNMSEFDREQLLNELSIEEIDALISELKE